MSPQPDTSQCMRAPPSASRSIFSPIGHLDHARAADVQGRLAVHHDHDVGQRGEVRRAGRRGPEQDAHLGDDARRAGPRCRRSVRRGSDRERSGSARRSARRPRRPGRAIGTWRRRGLLLDADDLLDRLLPPGAGLDRVVVGHDADRPAEDGADAGHDAVGRGLGFLRASQAPVFLELGAGIEQELQAIADEELAFLAELVPVAEVPLLDPRDLALERAPRSWVRRGRGGWPASPCRRRPGAARS